TEFLTICTLSPLSATHLLTAFLPLSGSMITVMSPRAGNVLLTHIICSECNVGAIDSPLTINSFLEARSDNIIAITSM
ncbi:MAG: hypothetical protein ACI84O_001528, partial [Myxococcota bacterium]